MGMHWCWQFHYIVFSSKRGKSQGLLSCLPLMNSDWNSELNVQFKCQTAFSNGLHHPTQCLNWHMLSSLSCEEMGDCFFPAKQVNSPAPQIGPWYLALSCFLYLGGFVHLVFAITEVVYLSPSVGKKIQSKELSNYTGVSQLCMKRDWTLQDFCHHSELQKMTSA